MPDKLERLLERRPSDECPFKTHCYCDIEPPHGELFNRDGPEALAEITRLKGEVDGMFRQLSATFDEKETLRLALAAKQALIDELIDVLKVFMEKGRMMAIERAQALLAKYRDAGVGK